MPGSGCRCRPRLARGGGGAARVDDDQAAAARALGQVRTNGGIVSASSRRPAGRRSAASRSASGNGSPRSRPKARIAGRGRRRHAEPAVVVDRARCRSATRANLPSRYAFSLVSPPPPKTPTASAAVRRPARAAIAGDDPVQRLVPADRAQLTVPGRGPAGWSAASGWSSSSARGPALLAQAAAVGRGSPGAGTSTARRRRRAAQRHRRTAGRSTGSASPPPGVPAPVELPTMHRLSCRQSVPPGGFRSGSLLFRSCQVGLTPHAGTAEDGWSPAIAPDGRTTSAAIADLISRERSAQVGAAWPAGQGQPAQEPGVKCSRQMQDVTRARFPRCGLRLGFPTGGMSGTLLSPDRRSGRGPSVLACGDLGQFPLGENGNCPRSPAGQGRPRCGRVRRVPPRRLNQPCGQ